MADEFRKTRLISELEKSRSEFAAKFAEVRHDIDVPAHLRRSFLHNKSIWIAGAAITGFVLAKLPARKKKVNVYVDKEQRGKIKVAAEAGLLAVAVKFLLTVMRPAATAIVSRKIADWLERPRP